MGWELQDRQKTWWWYSPGDEEISLPCASRCCSVAATTKNSITSTVQVLALPLADSFGLCCCSSAGVSKKKPASVLFSVFYMALFTVQLQWRCKYFLFISIPIKIGGHFIPFTSSWAIPTKSVWIFFVIKSIGRAPSLTESKKSSDNPLNPLGHTVGLLGMVHEGLGDGFHHPCGSLPTQLILWFCHSVLEIRTVNHIQPRTSALRLWKLRGKDSHHINHSLCAVQLLTLWKLQGHGFRACR